MYVFTCFFNEAIKLNKINSHNIFLPARSICREIKLVELSLLKFI